MLCGAVKRSAAVESSPRLFDLVFFLLLCHSRRFDLYGWCHPDTFQPNTRQNRNRTMKRYFFALCRSLAVLTATAVCLTAGLETASAQLAALKKPSEPAKGPSEPTRNEVPATPAVSPVAGAWQGAVTGPEQRMMFLLILDPSGNYNARIMFENNPGTGAPPEPVVTNFAGQWKTEGQELVLNDQADGSVERTTIELQGDRLTLKGIGPNGESITMQRLQPASNPGGNGPNGGSPNVGGPNVGGPNAGGQQSGPVSGTNPTGPGSKVGQRDPSPNHPPMVGKWFASGTIEGTRMECQVSIQPNGTYQAEFLFKEGRATSHVTENGHWKVRGGRMLFKSEDEEVVSVPFQVQGEFLILDYSEEIGLIAIMSRTPGQGQIRPSNPNGFGY
jgi:hypothetical protein